MCGRWYDTSNIWDSVERAVWTGVCMHLTSSPDPPTWSIHRTRTNNRALHITNYNSY
jgi:hypothetical protein